MRVLHALGLVIVLGACQSAAISGSPCERTSACVEPLVCASGTCRPQCVDDRDCATGETCASYRSAASAAVCVPPSTPLPCLFHSDCGVGLFCRSGACTFECRTDRDCDTGTCADGGCSLPATTPSMNDGGTLPDGAACSSVCGARCVDLTSDPQHCGRCSNACAPGQVCRASQCADCPAGIGCPPANDDCQNPLAVTLGGLVTHVSVDESGATPSEPTCNVSLATTYFSVTLSQRAVLSGRVESIGTSAEAGWIDGCDQSTLTCESGAFDQNGLAITVRPAGPQILAASFEELGPRDVDFLVWPIDDATPAMAFDGNLSVPVVLTARLDPRAGSGSCGLSGPDLVFYGTPDGNRVDLSCTGVADAHLVVVTPAGVMCPATPCDGTVLSVMRRGRDPFVIGVVGGAADTTGQVSVSVTLVP